MALNRRWIIAISIFLLLVVGAVLGVIFGVVLRHNHSKVVKKHPEWDRELSWADDHSKDIYVAADGTTDFQTISDAIDSIEDSNQHRVIIHVKAGVYREKVVFPVMKPFIELLGEGTDKTIISWGDSASDVHNGKPLGVIKSATVSVESDYFIARHISIENNAVNTAQAVSLSVSGTKAAFYDCIILGQQNALYSFRGLHYFSDSYIQGPNEVIIGPGKAMFEKCQIHSVAGNQVGSLTAQSRNDEEDSGFSFVNCRVTGSGNMFLGRAAGNHSTVVFARSYLDPLVAPAGWNDSNFEYRDQMVYFGEYENSGQGANTAGRVPWSRQLSYKEAKDYMDKNKFFEGYKWL